MYHSNFHIQDLTFPQISKVVYEAFAPGILEKMQELHSLVACHKSCKWNDNLQAWALGKMVPIGAQASQGGKSGDSYIAYKDMTIQLKDVSAITALMAHALVSTLFS